MKNLATVVLIPVFAFGANASVSANDLKPSQQLLSYFKEVVLGTESGDSPQRVRKWTANLRIDVRGKPTGADLTEISRVIGELNELVAPLELELTTESPNVLLYFARPQEFRELLPAYRPPNQGFHWVQWNELGEIYEATILVASTGVSQVARSHILREELTQSLGLLMDSNRYEDSIFYDDWTTVTDYSDLDKELIRLTYDPLVEPGTVPDFVSALN